MRSGLMPLPLKGFGDRARSLGVHRPIRFRLAGAVSPFGVFAGLLRGLSFFRWGKVDARATRLRQADRDGLLG